MRLRCSSMHAGHGCSILLDWLGCHAGDHASHAGHDLSNPPVATWPNDGRPSCGVPVAAPTVPASQARRSPNGCGCGCGSPATSGAAAPASVARASAPRARPDPYAYEITEWDLLPDA